jgi:uncharacterized protein (DUF58 family)
MDPSLRRRMKELEIRSLHLVNSRFMGEWASNMRGQGLEFRDLREYVPGDDVRRLDWKATARSGKPQLRQILAVLGWAAVKQGDRFAVMGFSDTVELHRPPARGEAQLWAALEDVFSHVPRSRVTSFAPVWEFFLKRLTHRATIIILSDFAAGLDTRMLTALSMRHDVMAFQLVDPQESGQNNDSKTGADKRSATGGLGFYQDSESGEKVWVDLSSTVAFRRLDALNAEERNKTRNDLRKAGVWYNSFLSGQDFLPPLMEFFHRRREVLSV